MRRSVLVVDDNVEFLHALKGLMERKGFIVSVATTLADALLQLHGFSFDHMILDLNLPDGPGEIILANAKQNRPEMNIVVVSGYLDGPRAASLVGKCVYLPKAGLTLEILLKLVLEEEPDRINAFAKEHHLSKREVSVLAALIDGLGVDATAERLGCKASTVKTYLQRMFDKTGRSSQIELLGTLVHSLVRDRPSKSGEYPALSMADCQGPNGARGPRHAEGRPKGSRS